MSGEVSGEQAIVLVLVAAGEATRTPDRGSRGRLSLVSEEVSCWIFPERQCGMQAGRGQLASALVDLTCADRRVRAVCARLRHVGGQWTTDERVSVQLVSSGRPETEARPWQCAVFCRRGWRRRGPGAGSEARRGRIRRAGKDGRGPWKKTGGGEDRRAQARELDAFPRSWLRPEDPEWLSGAFYRLPARLIGVDLNSANRRLFRRLF